MTHLSRTTGAIASDFRELGNADHECGMGSSIADRSGERYGYEPSGQSRLLGILGTLLIYGLVALGFVLMVNHVASAPPAVTLSVFDASPPASPPEVPAEDSVAPEPIEKHEIPPEPSDVKPVKTSLPTILPAPLPEPAQARSQPEPPARPEEAAAPKTTPAPPAPQVSDNAPDTWQGRVLARLNAHRRYPRTAQARRQQGVPYIRFVIDREGKVLSVRLERSSGVAALDREAMALPKRAQPLPEPPDDQLGETIELVAPVEFFLR